MCSLHNIPLLYANSGYNTVQDDVVFFYSYVGVSLCRFLGLRLFKDLCQFLGYKVIFIDLLDFFLPSASNLEN